MWNDGAAPKVTTNWFSEIQRQLAPTPKDFKVISAKMEGNVVARYDDGTLSVEENTIKLPSSNASMSS